MATRVLTDAGRHLDSLDSTRAAAVHVRLDVREVLAAELRASVPHRVAVTPEDDYGDAEAALDAADARELAADIVEALERRGYVVGRALSW